MPDAIGTRDALAPAYIHRGVIAPKYLWVWNGEEWIDISEHDTIDFSIAYDVETDENDEGEEVEYHSFRSEDPFRPRDPFEG
jgi:hypothetical protein